MRPESLFPVWSEPRVPRYLLGQFFSVLGFWTQATALNLHTWSLTGSTTTLGQLNFLLFAPVFLVSPFAGAALGARGVQRAAFLICAGSAVLSMALVLLAMGEALAVPVLMLVAVVSGTLNACELPTRQVLLSSSLSRNELLPSAFATTSCLYNVGRMIGPALAGMLLPAVGVQWCFVVAIFGSVVMAYGVAGLSLRDAGESAAGSTSTAGRMRAGVRLILSKRSTRFLMALLVLTSMLAMGYQTLIPSIAASVFEGGARTSGLLFSLVAAGSLTAGLCMSTRHATAVLDRVLLVAPWVAGAATLVLGLSTQPIVSAVLLVILGGAITFYGSGANAKLLQAAPSDLRGTIAGIYMMLFLGMLPVAQLIAGYLSEHLGSGLALVLMGSALLLGVFLCNVSLGGPQLVTLRLTRLESSSHCSLPPP